MRNWTTKTQFKIFAYSMFKVFFFPVWALLWLLLWPLKRVYREEKAKYISEEVKVFVHGVEQNQSDVTYELPEPTLDPNLEFHRQKYPSKRLDEYTSRELRLEEIGESTVAIQHYINAANKQPNKRRALLNVLDSCGVARQQVQINGNIFDQSIKAKKFQATVKANTAYVVGAVTLETHDGELVCREPRAMCLGMHDTYSIILKVSDADIAKLLGKKVELLWSGCPISALDDKHLYNIHQALIKGCWARGTEAKFSQPMKKAIITEYDNRGFKTSDIQRFMTMNEAYEKAQET